MEEAAEGVSFGALVLVPFSPSPYSGIESTCSFRSLTADAFEPPVRIGTCVPFFGWYSDYMATDGHTSSSSFGTRGTL